MKCDKLRNDRQTKRQTRQKIEFSLLLRLCCFKWHLTVFYPFDMVIFTHTYKKYASINTLTHTLACVALPTTHPPRTLSLQVPRQCALYICHLSASCPTQKSKMDMNVIMTIFSIKVPVVHKLWAPAKATIQEQSSPPNG